MCVELEGDSSNSIFNTLLTQFGRNISFGRTNYCKWNLDIPLCTWKITVKTVDCKKGIVSKKCKNCFFLLGKWWQLCIIACLNWRQKFKKKKRIHIYRKRKSCFTKTTRRVVSHLSGCENQQITEITVWAVLFATLFTLKATTFYTLS